jgi:hypothetical protein
MKIKNTKRVTDLFKPLTKGDRLTCAYLYADGHATAAFERRLPDLGGETVRYYKQIDTLGVKCSFAGRIVFHDYGGVAWLRCVLAGGVERFTAVPQSLENGSPNSQAKGLAVGYVTAETPFGYVFDYNLSVINGATHYQPDVCETFDRNAEDFGHRCPIAETLIMVVPDAPA